MPSFFFNDVISVSNLSHNFIFDTDYKNTCVQVTTLQLRQMISFT